MYEKEIVNPVNNQTNLFTNKFKTDYETFYCAFSDYLFFGKIRLFEIPRDIRPPRETLVTVLECLGNRIRKFLSFDFAKAKEIAEKRDKFVFKLFEHFEPVDIVARAYKARRGFGLAYARQVL